MKRQLLLSNSTSEKGGFLGHATDEISDFLGSSVVDILFVPYAAVTNSFDDYTFRTREPFRKCGYRLISIHECGDIINAISEAQAIAVGGGNSFCLLRRLYEAQVLDAIRQRIAAGIPYIGWSAGANLACPTIKTTNDMPIVWLPSLDALEVIPFQINPHYIEGNPPGVSGETRRQRLEEFTCLNRNIYVIGLPEGGMIRIEGNTIPLKGCQSATVFLADRQPTVEDSLQFLGKLLD